MLKYTINKNQFVSDYVTVSLDDVELYDFPSSDDNDMKLAVFYYSNEDDYYFAEGDTILINYRIDLSNNNSLTTTSHTFTNRYTILKVNEQKGLFTVKINKYYDLTLSSLTSVTDDTGVETWYFYFDDSGHFFENPVSGSTITRKSPVLYVESVYTDEDNNIITGVFELNCTYSTPNELSCVYDESTMSYLKNAIFDDNVATITDLKVYRETPLYERMNNIFIYIEKPRCAITIPLALNFDTNQQQEDMIQSTYVEDMMDEAINDTVDMEKDVYHPVIWDSSSGDYVEGINKEVDKIVFNFHFRQHRGDDWLVDGSTYWNGCYVDETDGKVKFVDNISEYSNIPYFSYGDDEWDRSKQSDLLTYLGFENSDVRYQKSKLSQSFIRIMFYDSMNPANQNLLYYSTIFIDAGALFGKYIKHVEDNPYVAITLVTGEDGEETIDTTTSLKEVTGVKVDREPYDELLEECDGDLDEIEELRLSCQLTVEDKFQSEGSSDGFYLYLWKDDESGVTPTDIYMKVEYNHAGYGRTIPFMMPFWDPNKPDGKLKERGIKSFQEILDDWNEEDGTDGQYGARNYMKYSYIHFKYKYDKTHKQHIYYLDDTFYGTDEDEGGVHFTDNVLTLNLYEGKMI